MIAAVVNGSVPFRLTPCAEFRLRQMSPERLSQGRRCLPDFRAS